MYATFSHPQLLHHQQAAAWQKVWADDDAVQDGGWVRRSRSTLHSLGGNLPAQADDLPVLNNPQATCMHACMTCLIK
jgi:hypothetical protein